MKQNFGRAALVFPARFAHGLMAAALLAASGAPTSAQVPITVAGRVIERGSSVPVVGATVQLRGVAERITDDAGGFVFARVDPGAHVFRIHALGYRLAEVQAVIRADTVLRIELEPQPVGLDPLRAEGRLISIGGRVTDRASGRPLVDAVAAVSRDRTETTDLRGRFEFDRIAAGMELAVEVSALGYTPVQVPVIAQRDTSLIIPLEPDPVGQRMIAQQVERIEVRSRAVSRALSALDRTTLLRLSGWTLEDVLAMRIPPTRPVLCLVIDESPFQGGRLRDVLDAYLAQEIERVEIIDRGRMVRVYTRRFIQRLIRDRASLQHTVREDRCA